VPLAVPENRQSFAGLEEFVSMDLIVRDSLEIGAPTFTHLVSPMKRLPEHPGNVIGGHELANGFRIA